MPRQSITEAAQAVRVALSALSQLQPAEPLSDLGPLLLERSVRGHIIYQLYRALEGLGVCLLAAVVLTSCAPSTRVLLLPAPAPVEPLPACPPGSRFLYVDQLRRVRVCEVTP